MAPLAWLTLVGSLVAALPCLAQGLERDPRPPVDRVAQAEARVAEDPDDPGAVASLFYRYAAAGRLDEARTMLERYRSLPGLPSAQLAEVALMEAKLLEAEGRLQAAIQVLTEAAETPHQPDTCGILYARIGALCEVRRDRAGAEAAYRAELEHEGHRPERICARLLDVCPPDDRAMWHLLAGRRHYFPPDPDADPELWRRVCQLVTQAYPDEHLAFRWLKSDDPEESISYARRAVELRPDLPMNHYILGVRLHEAGQREQAMEAFHRALDVAGGIGSVVPRCHLKLTQIHEGAGQLDLALDHCKQTLWAVGDEWWPNKLVELAIATGREVEIAEFMMSEPTVILWLDNDSTIPLQPAYLLCHAGEMGRMRETIPVLLEAWRESRSYREGEPLTVFLEGAVEEMLAANDKALLEFLAAVSTVHDVTYLPSAVRRAHDAAPEALAPRVLLTVLAGVEGEEAWLAEARALSAEVGEDGYAAPLLAEMIARHEDGEG